MLTKCKDLALERRIHGGETKAGLDCDLIIIHKHFKNKQKVWLSVCSNSYIYLNDIPVLRNDALSHNDWITVR